MIIFKKAKQLTAYLQKQKELNNSIGFVPTMGALHRGHLSLLQQCIKDNMVAVCSIFINPTQFNNPDDFKKYPVTIEKDIEQLINVGCSILFLPSVEEIYPSDYIKKVYDLGELETILEGHYRPGHFQGVCQVVDRLLSIVHPNRLYLGQKDFQQCMVIKRMVQQIFSNEIDVKVVETMREEDGLAMSSRNLRLNTDQRKKASAINKALVYIKNNGDGSSNEVIENAKHILKESGFVVDYVEIVNRQNLNAVGDKKGEQKIALIAATLGDIRLIDNMVLN